MASWRQGWLFAEESWEAPQTARRACQRVWRSKDLRARASGMDSPACRRFLSGLSTTSPWVVNGHWTDHSSQPDVAVFTSGWKRFPQDRYLKGSSVPYFDLEESEQLAPPNSEATLTFRFFEKPQNERGGASSSSSSGEVDLSHFKILGIMTC